jgi:hypothetical protein
MLCVMAFLLIIYLIRFHLHNQFRLDPQVHWRITNPDRRLSFLSEMGQSTSLA